MRSPMESQRKLRASRQRPTLSEAGEDLQLTRVRGVFQRFIQPQYVDFLSLEDMFEGKEFVFATQGWTSFLKSHK
ncbi:hypothetical protein Taro_041096 [Colocasia esculenta]|uniref:Uncharacterized protein n=1 Tax=Colocasia esculenta TaxID=4460 RepID=A0A843WDG8_COLES|nr:hypothetical protein [Colocasia esculenta]